MPLHLLAAQHHVCGRRAHCAPPVESWQRTFNGIIHLLRRDTLAKQVVILGGGWDGARLLRALTEELHDAYQVIGFLDDHPLKQGIFIRGVRVLGPLKHLYTLLASGSVDEVLIAMPEASGEQMREYVLACRKRGVPVKVITGLAEVLTGKVRARLEDISVEDLLRRPPVQINHDEMNGYLTGKERVLITGAGGSNRASGLVGQILVLDPESLMLLGHGENSIHTIAQNYVSLSRRTADNYT